MVLDGIAGMFQAGPVEKAWVKKRKGSHDDGATSPASIGEIGSIGLGQFSMGLKFGSVGLGRLDSLALSSDPDSASDGAGAEGGGGQS